MRIAFDDGALADLTKIALKPGFGEYMMPHVSQGIPLFFSSVSAHQVTCAAKAS